MCPSLETLRNLQQLIPGWQAATGGAFPLEASWWPGGTSGLSLIDCGWAWRLLPLSQSKLSSRASSGGMSWISTSKRPWVKRNRINSYLLCDKRGHYITLWIKVIQAQKRIKKYDLLQNREWVGKQASPNILPLIPNSTVLCLPYIHLLPSWPLTFLSLPLQTSMHVGPGLGAAMGTWASDWRLGGSLVTENILLFS